MNNYCEEICENKGQCLLRPLPYPFKVNYCSILIDMPPAVNYSMQQPNLLIPENIRAWRERLKKFISDNRQ